MSRIPTILLVLLALPAVCLAGSPAVLVPPGPLSSALTLVESNKVPEAMKALASYRPEYKELGTYHYVYGRGCAASGDPLEAASHYRRASIYATVPALMETALFLAAETEFGMGYRFEAKTDCLIFLKKFPDSWLAGKARILLGRSLAGIGRHRDAIRQFELAGDSPEGLYGKANALQGMGMTAEASRAYSAAAAVDGRFPASSDETRLWMGENLRLSGSAARARELLQTVKEPESKDRAAFGLGEIAASESRNDDALRLFGSVIPSKDKKLGRAAMLRISDVEASSGKGGEAVARLEDIISRFPFTPEYDQAVLRLARTRAGAGNQAAALSLLSKLVLRPSTVRRNALDEIEGILPRGEREPRSWSSSGTPAAAGCWTRPVKRRS
jgi:tetratricopeptide (TPR) repeat protein